MAVLSSTRSALAPGRDPNGGGVWTGVEDWPLIGLHAILTPDNQLLTFGTDERGMQGGEVVYDVWDFETNTHYTLPNTTGTDIFCSVAALIPATGEVLIAGGDSRPDGVINAGVKDANIFDPSDRSLTASEFGPMEHARWYATAVTLANGDVLVLGGIDENKVGVDMPEIYRPGSGFTSLAGAESQELGWGWFYPRAWPTSDGKVAVITNLLNGRMMMLDPTGSGSIEYYGNLPFASENSLPAVMYAQDKFLIMSDQGELWTVDVSGSAPTSQMVADLGAPRYYANMLILPDGDVMILGGGSEPTTQELGELYREVVVWSPDTGQTTTHDAEALGRLYHSTAILLPDGSVLSLGGGAPGPFTHTNGEFFFPENLFDAAGNQADRIDITSAPDKVEQAQLFEITVDNPAAVARVTMVKHGSVTHTLNMETRFHEPEFTVGVNGRITVDTTDNANVLTPGAWMVFVIDANGVPSEAATISVGLGGESYTPPGGYEPGNFENVYYGDAGNDPIQGTPDDDFMAGRGGQDNINGGAGNDFISAGAGADWYVRGGGGSDVFEFSMGFNDLKIFDFEQGADRILLTGGLTFGDLAESSSTWNGITTTILTTSAGDRLMFHNTDPAEIGAEDFVGGPNPGGGPGGFDPANYDAEISGDDGDNPLRGGDANEWFNGYGGRDNINGGGGDDYINAGSGPDWYVCGGSGRDVFEFSNASDGLKICDFEDGSDLIRLTGGLTFGDLTMSSVTWNGIVTTIYTTAGGDRLMFHNTDPGLISSDDFV